MRLAIASIAFLATTSCVTPKPTVEKVPTGYTLQTPGSYPADATQVFLDSFRAKWMELDGDDPQDYLDQVTIVWHDGDTFHFDYEVQEYRGVTVAPTVVHVATRQGLIRRTALAHELTHAILWMRDGDPDRDHEAGEGPWGYRHAAIIDELAADEALP